ncbi:MAG TPA: cytochrome C oxidase subunit IV family protein [Vicinamibacterales bacterium]|nr:cytochrome C oxidase subunit IV family protein [Vicinamibacterales bacterium]
MSGHVAPKTMYYAVFAALIVGTALTVAVAFVDLGALNNVVMLTIAVTKATLVVLYFMHVRWSTRLTWVVAASGFFWLLILFGLTMQDYLTRGWVPGTWR